MSELTTNSEGTDTASLNESLDTLSSTIDQIAPQLGPTFDGLTRISKALNERDTALGDLLKAGDDITSTLAQRSEQVNTLILNANDLVGVLSDRRWAIVELLTHTAAVAKEVSGLVHDNEQELAPTLKKLNSVLEVLERNRDNIALALPRLAKYQITLGEVVSNGPVLQRLHSQPRHARDIAAVHGLRVRVQARGQWRTTTRQRRSASTDPVPLQWNPAGTALMARTGLIKVAAVALAALLLAATAFVVHARAFGPTKITAVFTTATAIYPGDQVRISGVKVGTISAIRPNGAQADVDIEVDHGIGVPADAKAIIVAQNLVSARFIQLAPAYESGPRMLSGATIGVERTAVPVEWDEVKEQTEPPGNGSRAKVGR